MSIWRGKDGGNNRDKYAEKLLCSNPHTHFQHNLTFACVQIVLSFHWLQYRTRLPFDSYCRQASIIPVSVLLRYGIASLDNRFPTFRDNLLVSFSWLNRKPLQCLETSGTDYQLLRHQIPKERNPQLHRYKNIKTRIHYLHSRLKPTILKLYLSGGHCDWSS